MKRLLVLLLVLVCATGQCFTLRQIRSLSAANSIQNGLSFSNPGTQLLLPPEGGGLQWTVLVSGSAPSLTIQIQAQMTDGTWVVIAAPAAYAGSIPNTAAAFSFFGPYQDVRVAVTAYTSGTVTADIFVEY